MNSGCICCSLVGDFGRALTEVIEKYHPDRIIIEPSGVGKLSDVAKAVERVNEKEDTVMINSMVAVVDGNKAKMYMKNFGEFFNNQIESAGTVIISRTQSMSDEKIDALMGMLREHNKDAVIITTPWDELKGDQILAAMEKGHTLVDSMIAEMKKLPDEPEEDDDDEDEHEQHHHDHDEHEHHHHDEDHDHDDHDEHEHHHHHHHHHEGELDADDVFQSWGVETPHKFDRDRLESILKILAADSTDYGIILRAKGIVPAPDGKTWYQFDLTPGEYEIREGSADYTGRLCVIGSDLKEDKVAGLFGV